MIRMFLQIPFLSTILCIIVLVKEGQANALHKETSVFATVNQRLKPIAHAAYDANELSEDADSIEEHLKRLKETSLSSSHRDLSTEQDDKKLPRRVFQTEKSLWRPNGRTSSNPYDIILEKVTPNGQLPMKKYNGSDLLKENTIITEKVLSPNMDHSKHLRMTRDTTAQKHQRMSNTQQPLSYNLTHLSDLCPYTEICDSQAKESSQKSKSSCCLQCSCHPTCRKIGNCCDKQENIGYMCHSPVVKPVSITQTDDLVFGYLMVDRCLDGTDKECTELGSAPWGSLYPVYDPVSKRIFYNPQCAECSGVEEFTNWQINLECDRLDINNGHIRRVLQGKTNEPCKLKFIPPRKMTKLKHICSDNLIDRCNVTGMWEVHDAKLEDACARWYSPTIDRNGYMKFTNVYCQLCNGRKHTPEAECSVNVQGRGPLATQTLTIDYRRVSAVTKKNTDKIIKPTDNGGCSKDMVRHVSKLECREVLCPNGFVRSEGKCQQITSKLLNSVYYVQLQLLPITDKRLPLSYLRSLTDEQRKNPEEWFNTQGVSLDYFVLYFKETEYVQDLVVKVGQEKYPLSLNKEIKAIQNALTKPWSIKLKGEVFQFSVKFYKYARFVPEVHIMKVHHVLNHLSDGVPLYGEAPKEAYAVQVLSMPFVDPIVLKKTNFCNLVRLVRSEWIAGFGEIRLNTSKEVFDSKVFVGDSEFDIFLDEMGKPTVEICVKDFNPDYQEQQDGRNTAAILSNGAMLMAMWWALYLFY